MRLFTSNSKWQGVCKICVGTLLLGVLYYSVVAFVPKNLHGANQWQTNLIKAQDFVFEEKPYTHVFVGSSEAYNVPVEEISDNWANLGFASGCSLTGLEVLLRSGKSVDVVVVEVNETLLRGVDDDLLKEINSWHSLPMGRQNTRLDYLTKLCIGNVKRLIGKKRERKDDDNLPMADALKRTQTRMNSEFDVDKMQDMLIILKRQIDILKAHGIKVILVETPNDPTLYDSTALARTRELTDEILPRDEYERFAVDWQVYKTKDGIHLAELSAMRYANLLVSEF